MLEDLILASASARRADLLRSAGVTFEIRPAGIEELPRADETPRDFALRVARDKAHAVASPARRAKDDRPILGADTIVVIDDTPLGKPRDREHAARMLRRLAGRKHEVLTAFCLLTPQREHLQVVSTDVQLRALEDQEIDAYLDRGGWEDKAGAYAIQAEAGYLIREIHGSYSNVVGLPLCETIEVLQRFASREEKARS